ncbi:MAG: CvpA family protein [Planctomycetes bacterium]|nr:CvpA family protein [Planctomycetota bacterium]
MFIIIVAALLILGIAYYQVSQGLFNSLITAVLTILSAAMAMALYEPVVAGMSLYMYMPTLAEPVVLCLLFFGLVYGLRAVFDWAIRGNVVFGQWPDRIGGGIFGLLTGIIMVGMWIITMQLMPFDPSLLTYCPFNRSLQRVERLPPFYPDDFVLGMVNMLSDGTLQTGDRRFFRNTHEDLLLDAHCWRNSKVDKNGTYVGRKDTKPGSMMIVPFNPGASQTRPADTMPGQAAAAPIYVPPEQDPQNAEWLRRNVPLPYPLFSAAEAGKTKFVIVRVAIKEELVEESTRNNPAAGWYFLPATHFRLVGRSGRSYYPVAYLTFQPKDSKAGPLPGRSPAETDTGWLCICASNAGGKSEVASLIVQRPGDCAVQVIPEFRGLVVDWIFQVPQDEQFAPNEQQIKDGDTSCGFIVFRRIVRRDFDSELPLLPSLNNMLRRIPSRK